MSEDEHPAVQAVDAQLDAAVQRGEYRYAITFLDDRVRYADVPDELVFWVDFIICAAFCRECGVQSGLAPDALRQRVAAAIDAGALEFAVARLGRGETVGNIACLLLDVLTRYGIVNASALWRYAKPEVDAVSALVRYLSRAGDLAAVRSTPLAKVTFVKAGYDALLSLAGAPVGPPHKVAVAAADVPQGHCAAVLRAATAGKLHKVILSQVVQVVEMLRHLEGQNPTSEAAADMWTFLRSAGRVFRWMWMGSLWFLDPEAGKEAALACSHVTEAMFQYPGNDALQYWGLTYFYLPVVHNLRRRTSSDDDEDRFNREIFTFCRGRCCINTHRKPCDLDLARMIGQMKTWELATCAARAHANCVRPAARLMIWGAFGCPEVQRELNELGALDVLRQAARRNAPQRARRSMTPPTLPADADEEEEVGSDGERLSEWGDGDGPPPNLAGETSTQALVERALRVIAGETVAAVAERVAAADTAAAALLAELEGEKEGAEAAAARKKSKSEKKKGKAKAKLTSHAADTVAAAHDESDCGEGDDAQEDPAGLLNAQPAAAPSSAEAAATPESLFPWLSLVDAPGESPTGYSSVMPEDAPHEDDHLCVICLDAPRDTSLAGCADKHPAALCATCARRLLTAGGAQPAACPLCRAPALPI